MTKMAELIGSAFLVAQTRQRPTYVPPPHFFVFVEKEHRRTTTNADIKISDGHRGAKPRLPPALKLLGEGGDD